MALMLSCQIGALSLCNSQLSGHRILGPGATFSSPIQGPAKSIPFSFIAPKNSLSPIFIAK
uniref:Uncharacterized protein n=1 Tax=Manihot esculenta TaxID=3983 RepID=A0A2C9UTU4_MANES